jgi:hypothetical protein
VLLLAPATNSGQLLPRLADDLLTIKLFKKGFRFLDRRNSLVQFFLGLMPELIIPSVGPVVLLPEFVSTLPDLFFRRFFHFTAFVGIWDGRSVNALRLLFNSNV